MFDSLYLSFQYLYWSRPSGPPAPAPDGTTRKFISTPKGDLEILVAKPANPAPGTAPVVFLHGGMGSAWVWHEYMRFLAAHGITSYAVSARGHGESWHPSYLRMLYTTSKRDLSDDFLAGIKAVQDWEGGDVVLVGHSSGGGLSQFLLSEGDVTVQGLALLGSIPGSGSVAVNDNWTRLDRWFNLRLLLHFGHSNSPLSHPFLVKQVFFSDDYPETKLADFMSHMSRYEAFGWPLGMLFQFVDPKKALLNIKGWGVGNRLLIMAGTEDKLMTKPIQKQSAETYRTAFSELVREAALEAKDEPIYNTPGEGDMDNIGHGVQFAWVPGAGHHLQNDTAWEVGAEKLLEFLRQL
ncbi:Alpha/Beta hydrolase protein [Nemania sp. FL0916]|nr:Alpha/Beta hydrolase protein [Nemania sp. FL0916]